MSAAISSRRTRPSCVMRWARRRGPYADDVQADDTAPASLSSRRIRYAPRLDVDAVTVQGADKRPAVPVGVVAHQQQQPRGQQRLVGLSCGSCWRGHGGAGRRPNRRRCMSDSHTARPRRRFARRCAGAGAAAARASVQQTRRGARQKGRRVHRQTKGPAEAGPQAMNARSSRQHVCWVASVPASLPTTLRLPNVTRAHQDFSRSSHTATLPPGPIDTHDAATREPGSARAHERPWRRGSNALWQGAERVD